MKKIILMSIFFSIFFSLQAQDVDIFAQLGHSHPNRYADGGFVRSVMYSPDGKFIISGGFDKTIKIWNAETGKEIRTFQGHTKEITSIALDFNKKQIISGSKDGTIKIWNLENGKELKSFFVCEDGVQAIAYSPHGKIIVSSSFDKTIRIWSSETGIELFSFSNYIRASSVATSFDGKIIVAGYENGEIEVKRRYGNRWLTNSIQAHSDARKLHDWFNTMEYIGEINSIALSPDENFIASGSKDKTVKIFNIESDSISKNNIRELFCLYGHTEAVYSVNFSSDGQRVVSVDLNGKIKIWSIVSGEELFAIDTGLFTFSVQFSPDGKHILSSHGQGRIKLWDAVSGNEELTLTGNAEEVNCIAINHSGNQLAAKSEYYNIINIWDVSHGIMIKRLKTDTGDSPSIVYSSDGKILFSYDKNWIIKAWATDNGNQLGNIDRIKYGHIIEEIDSQKQKINFGAISLNLLDTETDKIIENFLYYGDLDKDVAQNNNTESRTIIGSYELSDGRIGVIKVFDTVSGWRIRTLYGHQDSVISVAYNPDGKQAVSGSMDNMIKIWDVEGSKNIKTLSNHSGYVNSVCYSPDGKQIFSGSSDGTTRLWDASTGKEIAQFISFTDGEWIVITPDGYYNASPKGDEYLNVRIGNEVYGIDQFSAAFYHPEVVAARLQGLPDPAIVRQRGDIHMSAAPPAVKVSIVNEKNVNTGKVNIAVTVYDDFHPVNDIEVVVNGRLIGGGELRSVTGTGVAPEAARLTVTGEEKRLELQIPLNLEPGQNYIEVIASNEVSYGIRTVQINVAENGQERKPDLWIMAIGINDYDNFPQISAAGNLLLWDDLKSAVGDAQKIIGAMEKQEGMRFNTVHKLLVTDNGGIPPSRENILLNMGYLKQANPNDVVFLFIAAHGITEEGKYYFLPKDIETDGEGNVIVSKAISIDDILDALNIPGRKIIFLDTCQSGGVDNNQLVRTLKNRSTVIISASQQNEYSFENTLRGGFFTYSVMEGLDGQAVKDGAVLIEGLSDFVSERVKQLSRDRQHPAKVIPPGFKDFVITRTK